MATYLLLNCCFLLVVVLVGRLWPRRVTKSLCITFGALLLLTTIFDSLIVGFGIVAYDATRISGVYVGKAPVEDFFYAVLAVILVPAVWQKLEKKT